MQQYLKEVEVKLLSQQGILLSDAKIEIDRSLSGFYWIYTNLPLENFLNSPEPKNLAHVNFRDLSQVHSGLRNVIWQKDNGYWCIYNGKAKNLISRIVAEFSETEGGTGTLALTRCFNENDFIIKYIACDTYNNNKGISIVYQCLQRNLERVWRLNNGWPVFCRT